MSPHRRPMRVRKARWPGSCDRCKGPIAIGEHIVAVDDYRWVHRGCWLKAKGLYARDAKEDVFGP